MERWGRAESGIRASNHGPLGGTHTGGEIGAVGRVRLADVRVQLQIQLDFRVSK